jgi:hypothetical protein
MTPACTTCSWFGRPKNHLCEFALKVPSVENHFRVSTLLLVSRQVHEESLPWAATKISFSFTHIECLAVLLPSLTTKQRRMVLSIRYYKTVDQQPRERLKDRLSVLSLTQLLEATLAQSSLTSTVTKSKTSQD